MYKTLREFVDALDAAGELKRITAPVSCDLEIAEIAHRMARLPAPSVGLTGRLVDPDHADLGGYALLFENIRESPSDIPVAINLFGSYRRMEMALGCHDAQRWGDGGFEAIARQIGALTKPEPPSGLSDLVSKVRQFVPVLKSPPRISKKRGRCQEIVKTDEDVNLFEIPMIKCWPLDGDPASVGFPLPPDQPVTAPGNGRFITLAGMYTVHADDLGKKKAPTRNIGMYRSQLLDRQRLAMHWHVHHDGASHWRSFKRAGHDRMPIAIVFGGESVLPYAATAPLPPGISELLMAGFLNRGPIRLVPCRTVPMYVPANAEIVIEGWVSTEAGVIGYDPREDVDDEGRPLPIGPGAVFEGPFGDHTGFYSLPDRYPVVEVTAITHSREPIYPTTIVGLPPQEDYYLGKATERIFFPLLKTLIHDIGDYDLPLFGCFHNCAFIRVRKEYPLQARRVMHAVWGAGQMAWTKMIVVVDDDVNVHRQDEVLEAIFRNVHFGRDLEMANGPLDILDHAAPSLGAGCKIGIDATRKFRGEEVRGVSVADQKAFEQPWDSGTGDRIAARLRQIVESTGEQVLNVQVPDFGRGRCAFVQIQKPDESGVNNKSLPAGRKVLLTLAEHHPDRRTHAHVTPADVDAAAATAVDESRSAAMPKPHRPYRRGGFGGLAEAAAHGTLGNVEAASDQHADETDVTTQSASNAVPAALDALATAAASTDSSDNFRYPDFVIVVDQVCDFSSVDSILFHLTANADPGRDLISEGGFAGFDATHKTKADAHFAPNERRRCDVRDFPPILEMDAQIVDRVTQRWDEYGFSGLDPHVPPIPGRIS
ncbi:MAG: UbiD family decarboxylase domain-containing protein [Planctomycetota bacterium]